MRHNVETTVEQILVCILSLLTLFVAGVATGIIMTAIQDTMHW
jgi:hypothetical protein